MLVFFTINFQQERFNKVILELQGSAEMEVAIVARFSAKGNVQIDARHSAKLSYFCESDFYELKG
jgi:hypothetical protein